MTLQEILNKILEIFNSVPNNIDTNSFSDHSRSRINRLITEIISRNDIPQEILNKLKNLHENNFKGKCEVLRELELYIRRLIN